MGTKSKSLAALAVTLAALAVPSEGSAAEAAETCAQGYMLCLNEATQNTDGWYERTRAETSCLLAYGACLKHQAIGL